MAKEFSAADIFNTRVEDEYQAEPEIVEETSPSDAEFIKTEDVIEGIKEEISPVVVNENTDEDFFFGCEDENNTGNKLDDIKQVLAKIPKFKKITLPKIKKPKLPVLPKITKFKELVKAEEVTENFEKIPTKKRTVVFTAVMVLLTVAVFALFGVFIFNQYSLVFPSHDDYGYATLSYVYWEEGMWGQNFTMDQLVHYLVQHYNRWGGRILSFGQSILLLREGLDVAQGFHAVTLILTFLIAFLFAQNGKKTRLLPIGALFTCAMFGMIGKDISISGFYWYCAAILYTVPVLYVFIGAWLLYVMLLDKKEKTTY